MDDIDRFPIYSVAVDPEYCSQCGTEVRTREFNAGRQHWCPECKMVLARNPLAAVHVMVHDDNEIRLPDEPIPQHEGVWSLPGGHADMTRVRGRPPSESSTRRQGCGQIPQTSRC